MQDRLSSQDRLLGSILASMQEHAKFMDDRFSLMEVIDREEVKKMFEKNKEYMEKVDIFKSEV